MLTKDEAQLFTRLCSFCWRRDSVSMAIYWRTHVSFIYPDLLDEEKLMHLGSIGLISEPMEEMYHAFPTKDGIHLSYFGRRFFVETIKDRPGAGATRVTTTNADESVIMIGNAQLTSIGRELAPIAGGEPKQEYLTQALSYMMTCNRGTMTELQ